MQLPIDGRATCRIGIIVYEVFSYTITQDEKLWTVQETLEEKDLGVMYS